MKPRKPVRTDERPQCRFKVDNEEVLREYDRIAQRWGYRYRTSFLKTLMEAARRADPRTGVIRMPSKPEMIEEAMAS